MPTYEFRCPDGHEFERFYRKISDAPAEVSCPECGKPAVRKLSGGAGLVFKGSGFYLTDYGKNAHRGTEPSGDRSKADAKASDSSKGDTSSTSQGDPAKSSASTSAEKQSPKAEPKSPDAKPAVSKPGKASDAGGSGGGSSSSGGKTDK